MKTQILTAFALMAMLTFVACGNAGEKEKTVQTDSTDHSGQDHAKAAPAAGTATVAQVKDDLLNAVYQQYSSLSKALVESDLARAKIAANAIEAGAKEMKNADALGKSAAKIAGAKDIESQRAAFSDLSNQLIGLVKKAGMGSGELYVDYCPMALNDKGAYWISGIKEIRNPYFGDKMLNCGELKETIQ
ncbi:DUF3347 domain-containing protein [Pseudobacter ginsenosidimutans]|jgi:hypothetical protein|uniref:Uncharacterized protein DUF3347 n=1 Tax=Pseudobacter ginsenosidimutans TaxID=661488 RepID=A0A4Q7N490_9BACT|nr:DUF3347 domain-containing protein [Pseudobacter ginsenosidimutans]QEC44350.1 DUF3347 domain-containing protein [Pseudobacter ginsenosidimutans]RZS75816.1 uncharacterized protein DUF3347 [Pseudobacter ginsenosidimutans]